VEVNPIEIKWSELFKPIKGLKTDVLNRIVIEREIIPIIFVPGIMGSRLEDSDGNKVWDPDAKGFMVNNFGRIDRTAAYRKNLLIGEQFNAAYLQTSNADTEHNTKFANENDPTRAERGWGGVFWSSYGDLLIALHNHQWEEPARHCFEFPVYAFGYNWTDSNYSSGENLAKYIKDVIEVYTQEADEETLKNFGRLGKEKRLCKYVILISHSMGGLVCRSACKLHRAEKQVLGVLHGVQPSTGAAAAYWRMKCGFERPHGGPNDSLWDWFRNPLKMAEHRLEGRVGAWILGTDGEEVTCILGNAPGGLELLPNKHYTNNEGKSEWLHVPSREGVLNSFPRSGDPYEEIYRIKDDVYWRMVNPLWLDPKLIKKTVDPNDAISGRRKKEDPWESYLNNLELAEQFQDALKTETHPITYQFYSSGYETVDEIRFTRKQHHMLLDRDPDTGMEIDYPVYPNARGECTFYLKYNDAIAENAKEVVYKIRMAMPGEYDGGGDSTVPDSSGKALKVKETAQIGVGARSDWFEQDHQKIYKSRKAKDLVYSAVGNFALKRIEEEIGSAAKK
jgi:pimeloyl-ACP methyl ester carboxylesterase